MKKKVFLIVISLIILASVPIAVILVKRNQELRLQAAPATTLSLKPATATKELGSDFTVEIYIDTGTNVVSFADIDISYNSQILTATSINAGPFFQTPSETRKNINTPGKIGYSILATATGSRSGSGVLAYITFSAIANGQTQVSFDSSTTVGDPAENTSVLDQTISATYTITTADEPTATPLVTATPIVAATATPVVTATATPIATLTPIPTDDDGGAGGNTNPTSTPTPTATRAPAATATPTTATTTTSTTATATATPTPITELPQTGLSLPTLILIIGATALFVGGLLFI